MPCKPMKEAEIWDKINSSFERMTLEQRRLWEVIKSYPTKWQLEPWGNQTGGFWVVAIIGHQVIWYNEIEDGFNISAYSTAGQINEYWCNQDELEMSVQVLINEIQGKFDTKAKMGPPEPI